MSSVFQSLFGTLNAYSLTHPTHSYLRCLSACLNAIVDSILRMSLRLKLTSHILDI